MSSEYFLDSEHSRTLMCIQFFKIHLFITTITNLGVSMLTISSYNLAYKNDEGLKKNAQVKFVRLDDFRLIESYIDKTINEIVSGERFYDDILTTKIEIKNLMIGKNINQKHGLVAEFFTHLVLRDMGFVQESIFSNLEESSMKKGFDGVYSVRNSIWIAESKSGHTDGIIHRSKINEAFIDLKEKLEGRSSNNPFRNAAFHMIATRKKPKKKLLDTIRELSTNYKLGKYPSLDEFNVIPVSTLFIKHSQTEEDIILDVKDIIDEMKYKEIIIICIDNKIYDDFLSYIGI